MSWGEWKRISEGRTAPGTPVTALLDGELFQVFVSDPAGGIYTARGSAQAGWGPWQSLSEGSTAPGTPVTALLDGELFQVFVSDPAGGIYTARGSAQAGWGPWQSLSEGSTAPGTPVTALLDGELFQVFVSDPAGGIYTARGSAQAGWGPWQSLSEGSTAPGTPVTALLDGELFQVFVSDPAGGIYTARGSAQAGWGPWQSLSEGSTAPGTPVTALLDGELFQVFVSDPAGGIYTARGSAQAGWGPWQSLSEGSTAPGTPVTALLDGELFQVFVSDPAGGIYTARGSAQAGWGPWQSLSEGRTNPGTAVSATSDGNGFFSAFVSDPAGGVYTATTREVPVAPQDLGFRLYHLLVSEALTPAKRTSSGETFFTVSSEGQFAVLYPGRIRKRAHATFTYRIRVSDPEAEEELAPEEREVRVGEPEPRHGGWATRTDTIPLRLTIFDPDGVEFTADEVTLADLRKHRDLRGSPVGLWSYKLGGQSEHFTLIEDDALAEDAITNAKGVFELGLHETVPSESAPPLVPSTGLDGSRQQFHFDLFRVGTFVVELTQSTPADPWHGSMRLLDPDGTEVASATSKGMRHGIDLAALRRSRDGAGRPRLWTLEVHPQDGVVVGSPRISATVIGSRRLSTAVLHERITAMIGERGKFIRIYGENSGGDALGRLVITDVIAAETIDMHGLLKRPLSRAEQDAGVDPHDINAHTVYTLYRRPEVLAYGIRLDVSTLKVGTIDVTVGPGDRLGAAIPAVKLKVKATGKAKVKLGGATVADGKIRGGTFELEVGIDVNPDGTPRLVTWVPDHPFDIDVHWSAVAAAGAIGGPLAALGARAFGEYVESIVNEDFAEGARELFEDPALAPSVLMTMLGAHLTYLPVWFEEDHIVFEYIAPLEPDPKPRDGYAGVIGRAFDELGPGAIEFRPPTLGDTWAADNLAKIDHIVVVMMENRSFDHVLGYRAREPINEESDGLTDEIIEAIQATDEHHVVRNLEEAGFAANEAGKMTRLPKGVGHSLEDVRQQLSGRAPGPGNTEINDPKGFVDNFTPRVGVDRRSEGGTAPGTAVTAVLDGDRFQAFMSDPAGGVYTARGGAQARWGQWQSVSEGVTAPGTPVTALLDDDRCQLFVSDPAGGVYTARGNAQAGWGPWQSVSEGSTAPGTPVTAVRDGDTFQVFVSDPAGGVYTARGNAQAGWGPWQSVSEGSTAPGTPVTAVRDGELFQVFVSDPAGGVYTARGNAQAGWGPWQSVSEGSTAPGTPVTALRDGDKFQLFVSDAAGGVYTARGNAQAGWGPWRNVSEGVTAPGTPVTALRDGDVFQLFVSDPAGGIYTARGNAQAGWVPWQSVSDGRTKPGTPVTAVRDGESFQLFVSDPAGGIYTTRGSTHAGWRPWLGLSGENETLGVVPDDVLGYYDGSQLPMFEYLARQYAYCDRYYCSHPGPTLPNRMYSLTGDVQYDRLGVPILDNNHGDNFLLSRALTIYDVFTKLGLSWRVYESNPSMTMLRMYARYATNHTDIVPIARLEADLASGDLPDFTVIDPQMHAHPQDDDHPDADMWRGQKFIQRVYKALRNAPTWEKTLLIITYDEHGGLYDHVVPPVADLLTVSGSIGGVGEVGPEDPEPPPPDEAQPSFAIPYGVRVPTFVVSPWTMRGKGPSITLDHCSILKTVLARFAREDRPFMSDRVHASQSFESYLSGSAPRMVTEELPDLADLPIEVRRLAPGASAIETPPLSRKSMRQGPVDYHELTGRLARMLGR